MIIKLTWNDYCDSITDVSLFPIENIDDSIIRMDLKMKGYYFFIEYGLMESNKESLITTWYISRSFFQSDLLANDGKGFFGSKFRENLLPILRNFALEELFN